MKREQKPRHRRMDLINSLPLRGQKEIAQRLGVSKSLVSATLNGYRSQDGVNGINIIRLAEQMAARERGRMVARPLNNRTVFGRV